MFGNAKKEFKSFLRGLRRAPEKTKRLWVISLSTATMLVVLGIWVVYVRTAIPKSPTVVDAENSVAAGAPNTPQEDNSFFAVMGRGLQNIFGGFKNGIGNKLSSLKNSIDKPNNFTVQGGGESAPGATTGTENNAVSTATPTWSVPITP
jgi:hypothetical protein